MAQSKKLLGPVLPCLGIALALVVAGGPIPAAPRPARPSPLTAAKPVVPAQLVTAIAGAGQAAVEELGDPGLESGPRISSSDRSAVNRLPAVGMPVGPADLSEAPQPGPSGAPAPLPRSYVRRLPTVVRWW